MNLRSPWNTWFHPAWEKPVLLFLSLSSNLRFHRIFPPWMDPRKTKQLINRIKSDTPTVQLKLTQHMIIGFCVRNIWIYSYKKSQSSNFECAHVYLSMLPNRETENNLIQMTTWSNSLGDHFVWAKECRVQLGQWQLLVNRRKTVTGAHNAITGNYI